MTPYLPPMLAQDLPDGFTAWPALASPKIDGVRGLAVRDEHGARLYTRTGQPIHALPELLETLDTLPFGVFDGELHHPDGFQTTCSIVTRGLGRLHPERQDLRFHLFDHADPDDWQAPHQAAQYRAAALAHLLGGSRVPSSLQPVPQRLVFDRAHLEEIHAEHLASGYEGTCLRSLQPYQHGRAGLWRLKPTRTVDALVLAMEPGRPGTQFARMMGRLWCEDLQTKARFRVGSGFSQSDRQAADWTGQIIEVQCKGLTEARKPREPIFLRRRPDRIPASPEVPGSHPPTFF